MQQSTVIEMIYLPITITNAFKRKVVSLQLFHLIREGDMFLEIKKNSRVKAPSMISVIFLTKYQNIPVIIHSVTWSIYT